MKNASGLLSANQIKKNLEKRNTLFAQYVCNPIFEIGGYSVTDNDKSWPIVERLFYKCVGPKYENLKKRIKEELK